MKRNFSIKGKLVNGKQKEFEPSQILSELKKDITIQKILSARTLINTFNYSLHQPIENFEFSVFSQWGDDGIIQYLIRNVSICANTFIEFGVENYLESNTRFLLVNDNWNGMVLDGSKDNIEYIRRDEIYWKYNLHAENVFVDADNINGIISSYVEGDIGLLHIDIDGNDYWIWKALTVVSPDIVIIEFNSVFGCERAITTPYIANFKRNNAHFSNLYAGASLPALCELADEKGYYFIGSNSAGNNAYFIKKSKIEGLKPLTAKEGYVESKFRESRDERGNLTFLSGQSRLSVIGGKPVVNTRTGKIETL